MEQQSWRIGERVMIDDFTFFLPQADDVHVTGVCFCGGHTIHNGPFVVVEISLQRLLEWKLGPKWLYCLSGWP
jgi:hypothetical protein